MQAAMTHQIMQPTVVLPVDITAVPRLSCVRALVLQKVSLIFERLTTYATCEWSPSSMVTLLTGQDHSPIEHLAADITTVRPLSRVNTPINQQVTTLTSRRRHTTLGRHTHAA